MKKAKSFQRGISFGDIKKIFSLVFLFVNITLSATDYYVKNGGNDANSGLDDAHAWAHHPWMSTWTGKVVLAPGDVVHMKRGHSWTISKPTTSFILVKQSGTSGKYITTTWYGTTGNKPLIAITENYPYSVISGAGKSYIIFDNIEVKHYSSARATSGNGQIGITFGKDKSGNVSHDWIITNCEIHSIPGTGIAGTSDSYNVIIGDINATSCATRTSYSNHIYDCGYAGVSAGGCNPATLRTDWTISYNYIHKIDFYDNIERDGYGIAFSASTASTAWPSHCTVKYNRVEDVPNWHGLDNHGGSYLYYTDNYFYNCRGAINAFSCDREGRPKGICDNVYIERNIIENSGNHPSTYYYGIVLLSENDAYPVTNCYVRDNIIFYTSRPTRESSSYGIRAYSCNGVTIERNKIYNGPTSSSLGAIYLQNSGFRTKNVIVRNNWIKDWSWGIGFRMGGKDEEISIYQNVIFAHNRGVGSTYKEGYTGNIKIFNNVIMMKPNSSTADPIAFFYSIIPAGSTMSINNNIISYTSSTSTGNYIRTPITVSGKLNIDYNLYNNSTKSSAFYLQNVTYSVANWKSKGFDKHSQHKDPHFSNKSGSYSKDLDFVLLSTSPAIDTGLIVGLPFSGKAPDVGAFEYTYSNVTPVNNIKITSTGGSSAISSDGGTLQLSAAVLPDNATNKNVTWSLLDGTGLATISSNGLVTAVNNGNVIVKATANDGSGISGTFAITISKQIIPVSSIAINSSNGSTTINSNGGTLQLSAIVLPTNATDKTYTWSVSNNTGEAAINSSGLLTAISNGTVLVKATASNNSDIYGNIVITISNQSADNSTPVINDQKFTIYESTFSNNHIGKVVANDADNGQQLTYSIISGNSSGLFLINSLSGEITTKSSDIFGAGTISYNLQIKVTDDAQSPKSSNALVNVTLISSSKTVHINPDNVNDVMENGSIEHPYDSWKDVKWTENYTYLQKRGTTTQVDILLIGANNVTISAYGEGKLPVITSETNTYLISGFEKSGIKIKDFNLKAINAVSCIYFLGNSGDSIVVEHCEIISNANAIKVVDGNTLVSKYNTITSNHEGIYSTAVSNEIYYNIFKDCNTAVNIGSVSSKANIYNNVFFDNEKSLSISYAQLTLYNNIFYMTSPGQIALNQGTGTIKSDHNIFYPEQDGFITIANTLFNTLDDLQKSLKIDMNSFNTDPLFIDIYNENFSVKAESPAVNAGIDLKLGIDFAGSIVPLAGAADIGITEYTGIIKNPGKEKSLILYPNPSSGQVNILAEIEEEDIMTEKSAYKQPEIQIMDMTGKTVFLKRIENQNNLNIHENIDLSEISHGLYLVILHLADKVIKEKLIITK